MPPPKCAFRTLESFEAKKEQTLLDVGTGSGILAIYGAKLGFGKIVAIDVDPEAVRWAERNIGLNGAENAITLSGTAIEVIDEPIHPGMRKSHPGRTSTAHARLFPPG